MKQYRIKFEEDEAPDLWDRSMYLSNVDEGTGQKRLYVSHVPYKYCIKRKRRGRGLKRHKGEIPPKKLYKVENLRSC
jgi:hypothetical protein